MFDKETILAFGILLLVIILAITPSASSETIEKENSQEFSATAELSNIENKIEDIEDQIERLSKPAATISSVNPAYTRRDSEGNPYEDEDREYIIISTEKNVNLTGWKIKSQRTGNEIEIGLAQNIAGESSSTDVVAPKGSKIVVVSGDSPVRQSFRINTCVGHLERIASFNPPLPYRPERGEFFAYNECLLENKNNNNFLDNEWRIYAGKSESVWKYNRDTIDLINPQGVVIDTYSWD